MHAKYAKTKRLALYSEAHPIIFDFDAQQSLELLDAAAESARMGMAYHIVRRLGDDLDDFAPDARGNHHRIGAAYSDSQIRVLANLMEDPGYVIGEARCLLVPKRRSRMRRKAPEPMEQSARPGEPLLGCPDTLYGMTQAFRRLLHLQGSSELHEDDREILDHRIMEFPRHRAPFQFD